MVEGFECELDYVAVGVNSNCNNLDWGLNGLMVYGASCFVVVFDPSVNRLVAILRGHDGLVNVTGWLTTVNDGLEDEIFSGGADGNVIIWKIKKEYARERKILPYERIATLEGHEAPVICISDFGAVGTNRSSILVSASSNGRVIVWLYTSTDPWWQKTQVFEFGTKLVESIASVYLPDSRMPIFACGIVDGTIHLFAPIRYDVQSTEFWRFSALEFGSVSILKGHEDSIRSLQFKVFEDDGRSYVMLASAGQDRRVRIWKVEKMECATEYEALFNVPNHVERGYGVVLESIMLGHDDWVTCVRWKSMESDRSLMTCSMDRSVVIWEYESMWMESVRVGSIGGAGNENQVGYFCGAFSPDGESIVCVGYAGTLHRWGKGIMGREEWIPMSMPTGHSDEVCRVEWGEFGTFFVSFSKDRTCRVWCLAVDTGNLSWNEVSRPLTHGYDLCSGVILPGPKLVVCSEEKVMRVYEMPRFVRAILEDFGHFKFSSDDYCDSTPFLAHDQPLSLSNKPIYDINEGDAKHRNHLVCLPPIEDELSKKTLWPEIHKLYGHGNNLASIDASSAGDFLASACISNLQTQELSHILLWDTRTWTKYQTLVGPKLTVMDLEFSHDAQLLAATSRDHGIYLYARNTTDNLYHLAFQNNTEHNRPILAVSWSLDNKILATGGRDKKLVFWPPSSNNPIIQPLLTVPLNNIITSIAWTPYPSHPHLLGLGFNNGNITLYSFNPITLNCLPTLTIPHPLSHNSLVKCLTWRPNHSSLELLSSSTDHSIRIFHLQPIVKNAS